MERAVADDVAAQRTSPPGARGVQRDELPSMCSSALVCDRTDVRRSTACRRSPRGRSRPSTARLPPLRRRCHRRPSGKTRRSQLRDSARARAPGIPRRRCHNRRLGSDYERSGVFASHSERRTRSWPALKSSVQVFDSRCSSTESGRPQRASIASTLGAPPSPVICCTPRRGTSRQWRYRRGPDGRNCPDP